MAASCWGKNQYRCQVHAWRYGKTLWTIQKSPDTTNAMMHLYGRGHVLRELLRELFPQDFSPPSPQPLDFHMKPGRPSSESDHCFALGHHRRGCPFGTPSRHGPYLSAGIPPTALLRTLDGRTRFWTRNQKMQVFFYVPLQPENTVSQLIFGRLLGGWQDARLRISLVQFLVQ